MCNNITDHRYVSDVAILVILILFKGARLNCLFVTLPGYSVHIQSNNFAIGSKECKLSCPSVNDRIRLADKIVIMNNFCKKTEHFKSLYLVMKYQLISMCVSMIQRTNYRV